MKKRLIVSLALSGLLVVPTILAQTIQEVPVADSAKQKPPVAAPVGNTDTKKVFVPAPIPATPGATVVTKDIVYSGSDSLALGDPLGNSPVNAMHDAGPPLTRSLPYGHSCTDDACIRAQKRWDSGGTWKEDRASGLSKGWGESSSEIKSAPKAEPKSAPKSESTY